MKIFGIFDSKSSAFVKSFFAPFTADAVRAFEGEANNKDSMYYKYPNDFQLIEIGVLDPSTGQVESVHHLNLGTAATYQLKQPQNSLPMFPQKLTTQNEMSEQAVRSN